MVPESKNQYQVFHLADKAHADEDDVMLIIVDASIASRLIHAQFNSLRTEPIKVRVFDNQGLENDSKGHKENPVMLFYRLEIFDYASLEAAR